MINQIHWHEGLFLQPHHLQQLQRGVLDSLAWERRQSGPFPYGVIEAAVSGDDLTNFRVRCNRLTAVMPSGLVVHYPGNAELGPLDIKEAFAGETSGLNVVLAVPLWDAEKANAFEPGQEADPRVKLLYRLQESSIRDENTGENPQPVYTRRINARLALSTDDLAGMETLPLLRVVPATGDALGTPRLDQDFAPPCLHLAASPRLREIVRDLVQQVEASRRELVVQINRGGFSMEQLRGIQLEQLMRLRILNAHAAVLPSLSTAPAVSPFAVYLELRRLQAELAALSPDRDDVEIPPYRHETPLTAFKELERKIRDSLRGSVAPSFLKVGFKRQDDFLAAEFTPEHFSKPNAWFLGIKTSEEPRALVSLVEDGDRFKFMPSSFATKSVRGIRLKEERIPPLELPAQTGLHYFRVLVEESGPRWQMLEKECSAAIRWPGMESSDYAITLYMTVPANQGS
ncbi:MAG: type VI secretion system baseplate subunit TssK [Puniceicoccaceae bacterium]|nr:MAG: type VI secretion system baseplate subunit TssK [Puniceicoccaceae bacterium]